MNNLVLILAEAQKIDHAKQMQNKSAMLVGASVLALDTGAFSALTTRAWCGLGGAAGFDDRPVARVCPGYGQLIN